MHKNRQPIRQGFPLPGLTDIPGTCHTRHSFTHGKYSTEREGGNLTVLQGGENGNSTEIGESITVP